MKKLFSLVILFLLVGASLVTSVNTAAAEEIKMIGTISSIEMAADQKSATVVLKDMKTEKDVTIIISDELTLDKFKEKKIVDGDEIRCKYDNATGKNLSISFKKTAGC